MRHLWTLWWSLARELPVYTALPAHPHTAHQLLFPTLAHVCLTTSGFFSQYKRQYSHCLMHINYINGCCARYLGHSAESSEVRNYSCQMRASAQYGVAQGIRPLYSQQICFQYSVWLGHTGYASRVRASDGAVLTTTSFAHS